MKSTEKLNEGVTIMNKSKAVKAAIAFKRGMAFVRGMQQLAQDADVPEGARWITVGAHENGDGESSGGRHVLIDKESGTILKGLSREAQGKTLKEAFNDLNAKNGKPEPEPKAKKAEPKAKKPAKIELGRPYEISNGKPFTKESLDTIKSYFGSLDGNNDELSDDNSDQISIWYNNGKFEVFTPESDPADLAKALNKKGIKTVVWDSGYGTTYYGSEKTLQLRNPDTNEVKTLDELRRTDLDPESLWIVDDVAR